MTPLRISSGGRPIRLTAIDPIKKYLFPFVFLLLGATLASAANLVFPASAWAAKTPAELGLDGGLLDQLAEQLGGRGCVLKDGYVVKTWGDQATRGDWYSSAKPVLSTMLFFAV